MDGWPFDSYPSNVVGATLSLLIRAQFAQEPSETLSSSSARRALSRQSRRMDGLQTVARQAAPLQEGRRHPVRKEPGFPVKPP